MQHALMNPHRVRGLVSVRADAAELTSLITKVNTNFETFKQTNDENLKKRDVVLDEKLDRINAAITKDNAEVKAAIDQINADVAALKIGGGGDEDGQSPEQREYAKAYGKFLRKGVDAGLGDLAVKAAVSTDNDPSGGYTVPETLDPVITRVQATRSPMRQIAEVKSISTNSYKKLVGQGGSTSGWVGEREARTETNTSTLAALEFPTHEIYAMPGSTQIALDDSSIDVAAWLAEEVGIEFAEEEGTVWISGDGVNKPRGLLGYDTVADASYAWGKLGFIVTGEAADFIAEDPVDPFINVVYALKQGYRQNAQWLMNKASQAKIRKFKDDADNYMWTPPFQGGVQGPQPATFLGYTISDDDNMSNVGANAFPVAFGDFRRGYLIVDRIGVRVLRDPYTSKGNVLFYTTKRVGGGVQNFEAIKLLKCST